MAFEQVMVRMADGQEFGPTTMPAVVQWHREGRVPAAAVLVDTVTGEMRPVSDFPALCVPPPPMPGTPPPDTMQAPSATAHLIPTRNMPALFAYYCGIFGIIPCFTVLLGPAALILGCIGLGNVNKVMVGKTHAWTGIILGGIETLVLLAVIVILIVAAAQS